MASSASPGTRSWRRCDLFAIRTHGALRQGTTRRLVRALWSPVGASVMPQEESQHLIRTLFARDEGRAMADRIDRRVDGLPGLAGLDLMAGALQRYG